jgi:hypothetical protein
MVSIKVSTEVSIGVLIEGLNKDSIQTKLMTHKDSGSTTGTYLWRGDCFDMVTSRTVYN